MPEHHVGHGLGWVAEREEEKSLTEALSPFRSGLSGPLALWLLDPPHLTSPHPACIPAMKHTLVQASVKDGIFVYSG